MKTGFLEEAPGVKSASRLIFVVGMLWLMAMSSLMLINKLATPMETATIFGTVSGVLGGVKILQKSQEAKPTN